MRPGTGRGNGWLLAALAAGAALAVAAGTVSGAGGVATYGSGAKSTAGVDTALIVSVDVSSSLDERRYQIQMEGIAAALEDPGVIDAIVGGPRGGILFALVSWADQPTLSLPWMRIASRADAVSAALKIRALPRQGGDFTCLARMLRYLNDKVIPQMPMPAQKVVVDVSGDGSDNCNPQEPPAQVRDEIAAAGTTINGLPILEGREAATLEGWYRDNVMGGPGAFILPANGFEDFGRAIRQKFVVEVSGVDAAPASSRAEARDVGSLAGSTLNR